MNVGPAIVASRCSLAILSRDRARGELASAVAASSIAVGARCPRLQPGLAVLTSQGFTNPKLGPLAFDLLRLGLSAPEVLQALRQHDRWIDYRQLAILTADGTIVAHTGEANTGWAGHAAGEDVICLANGLGDGEAVAAMLERFGETRDRPLPARLLAALEAGRAAACGRHGLLSAALLAGSAGRRDGLDLRVDIARPTPEAGGDALADLIALHDRYAAVAGFYAAWPDNPELARGNWREWRKSDLERHATHPAAEAALQRRPE